MFLYLCDIIRNIEKRKRVIITRKQMNLFSVLADTYLLLKRTIYVYASNSIKFLEESVKTTKDKDTRNSMINLIENNLEKQVQLKFNAFFSCLVKLGFYKVVFHYKHESKYNISFPFLIRFSKMLHLFSGKLLFMLSDFGVRESVP